MAVMNVMVGVRNSNKLKQTSPSHITKVPPIPRLRESKRLLKGRKVGNDSCIKILHRTVELARGPIDYGNESQKLLFLTGLGLLPKPSAFTMPPYVKLERFDSPTKVIKNSNNYQTNNSITVAIPPCVLPSRICRKSDRIATTTTTATTTMHDAVKDEDNYKLATRRNNNTPILYTDSDIEDLDLELLICPYDIPHIFEEFFTKKSYRKPDATRRNNRISKHTSNTHQHHHHHNINNKRNICNSYNMRRQSIRNNRSNIIKNNELNRQNAKHNNNNNSKHNRNRSITQLVDIPFIDLTDDDEAFEDMNYEKSYLLS